MSIREDELSHGPHFPINETAITVYQYLPNSTSLQVMIIALYYILQYYASCYGPGRITNTTASVYYYYNYIYYPSKSTYKHIAQKID